MYSLLELHSVCCFDLYVVVMDYCERCDGLARPSRCRCCRQILGRRRMPKRNLRIFPAARTCKCSPPQQPPAESSSEIQKLLDQCMSLLPDHSSPLPAIEERVECLVCGKFLKNKRSLRSHKSRYHRKQELGSDGSSCDLCPRIFRNKKSLAIHMTKSHQKNEDGQ